ncbi:MAG: aminomethyl-transferring glycine dehydrogenase subunit GcvPA, partial [Bacilli bacterium]|nr:aminomethyl-transferring glycine dehydrogenase subunit GcvPA [Bacilli bacterium]
MITNNFAKRHNGPQAHDIQKMLDVIGVSSIDELIDKTIPSAIRLKQPLNLPQGMNEYEYITHMKELASKNKIFKSYIGMGYYNTITPGVLQRNILENPGWYTAYTPYQAEISQGRLEVLFTFQTTICSLTAMPIANASMLDEATAAAEAMLMFYGSRSREQQKNNVIKFFVDSSLFPQNLEVIKTRALPKGIELVVGNPKEIELDNTFFGAILQYPNLFGEVNDYSTFTAKAKEKNIFVAFVADILSLALLTPPGELGADVVCGNTQRFGVPMGYGGPHAGYFACTDTFKRTMPGRIVGLTVDAQGNKAFRLALQTREQHIKREKATSNICTASALVAIVAAQYAAYHGQEGIKEIAKDIHCLAGLLSKEASAYGFKQLNKVFFDTLHFETPVSSEIVCKKAIEKQMNFNILDENHLTISIDETTSIEDINSILEVFASSVNKEHTSVSCNGECSKGIIPESLLRKSEFLKEEVFSKYHSETDMMRYLKKLEIKDLSLNRAMIPLGSCTMKLNAAAEVIPFTWVEFGSIHPFAPKNQTQGYLEMIDNMDMILSEITGFAKV